MASAIAAFSRPATKARILIVDDEEGIRDLLKTILERDYDVSEAASGAALRDALKHDQPDVVLLDMKLPDGNGLGLLPAIKERWPATEVIVLTGEPNNGGSGSSVTEVVNRGAFSLIAKSAGLDFQELRHGIGMAVARRQQVQANNGLRLGV